MLIEALHQVIATIERLRLPYALMGGLAVLKYGGRTSTVDVDVTVMANLRKVENLLQQIRLCGWAPEPGDAETALERGMIRWWAGEVRVDIMLAQLAFQKQMIRDAKPDDVFGYSMRFAMLEDLILLKVLADRPVDRRDVEDLIELHGSQIDRRRLQRWARRLEIEGKITPLLPKQDKHRGA